MFLQYQSDAIAMKRIINLIRSKVLGQELSILNSKGFTLIEMLVAIGVFVVVGSIAVSILFSALRGTNKTNVITIVRQNGNYAISQMEKMIRNAKSFEAVSADLGYTWETVCNPSTHYRQIKISSFDDVETTFKCNDNNNISSVSASGATVYLLDTSSVSLPSTIPLPQNRCYFTCSRPDSVSPPIIGINFYLTDTSTTGFAENKASQSAILFQTSVQIRNDHR